MAEKAKEKETKAVAPRRPFMDLSRWERDMERMMEDFFGRRTRPWWPERWFRTEGMEVTAPAVDLYEEKDDIVVKAELPGIDKNNIEVNLTDHTLTIKGEKKKEEEAEGAKASAVRVMAPSAARGGWTSCARSILSIAGSAGAFP